MTAAVYAAFDLGASSCRAMLGSFDGERVSLEEVDRFPTRAVRLPDGLYWDALGLFDRLTGALAAAAAGGRPVASVGIDSWAVDFGLLDRRGTLLANPLSHRDGRGRAGMAEALRRVPAEELYGITGIQLLPINTAFQLLALEGSSLLERARTLLLLPDLLGWWLTGERRAEETNASTTQLLGARSGAWALGLADRLGLPGRILPPLLAPGERIGPLLPHVREATRLPESTPLVAVASHDTASAVAAAPLDGPGCAYISSGTWSLVGVEQPDPVLTEAARAANLTNERGFGGTTRLLKNVMGLWLVQECRRAWAADGAAPGYAELAQLAAAAPGGPLFDPDLPELLEPGADMPGRIRAACAAAGQEPPADRPQLLRAVFESLACKYRLVLESIEEVTGRPIDRVHVIGGGSQNELLCRLTADVTRRPVLCGPVEAAALGNVLVQLHAAGEVASLPEMRDLVRRSTAVRAHEPADDADPWNELYERFRAVVSTEALAR